MEELNYEMQCEICGHGWMCEEYGATECPKCGQDYNYEEDIHIILTEEQKHILRKEIK